MQPANAPAVCKSSFQSYGNGNWITSSRKDLKNDLSLTVDMVMGTTTWIKSDQINKPHIFLLLLLQTSEWKTRKEKVWWTRQTWGSKLIFGLAPGTNMELIQFDFIYSLKFLSLYFNYNGFFRGANKSKYSIDLVQNFVFLISFYSFFYLLFIIKAVTSIINHVLYVLILISVLYSAPSVLMWARCGI